LSKKRKKKDYAKRGSSDNASNYKRKTYPSRRKQAWRTVMTNLEYNISKNNIRDQLAAFLSASGLIHDYEDIVSIDFSKLADESEFVPIIIKTKKREVYDEESLDGYDSPVLNSDVKSGPPSDQAHAA
jgi:hypothetical protein